jgi:lipoprotein NlpI
VTLKAHLRALCMALAAAAVMVAVMAAGARAQAPGCGGASADWIAGCTAVIDNPATPAPERAKALRIRGIAYFKRGEFDEAIVNFSASIALGPKNAAVYVNRAAAFERRFDFAAALADYNSAAALDPKQPGVFFERGKTYQAMHDPVHARQDFDEAIRPAPRVAAFFLQRGQLRKEQRDLAGAAADYDSALRLNPSNVLALLARGDLLAAQRDYDKAFAGYNKALAVSANSPQIAALVYTARAMAMAEKGDLKRALDEYDALLKIEPDDPVYLVGRAYTAFAVGNFAEAAAGFGSLLQKKPESFYPVLMRFVARARLGEHDTPELRRNAEALDRNAWPWPLIALFLGEIQPDDLVASISGPEQARRTCEIAFFLAEYDLLHRRRDEAAALMQKAATSCAFDFFERNAAVARPSALLPEERGA